MTQAFWDLIDIVFFGFVGSVFLLTASWLFMMLLNACDLIRISKKTGLYTYAFAILIVLMSLLIQNSDWPAYFK